MTDQSDFTLEEADDVAELLDSDVLLLNGPIHSDAGYDMDYEVAKMCQDRRRMPNVLFMPVTYGGDAHVAYRLASVLQEHYTKVTCYITGYCKSAGTLVAIGAHQLIMADRGELGPLDVQISKEDEIGERRSGLTALSALETLHQQAFEAFRHFMLSIKFGIERSITTRTATQMAADLTGKLMEPIYGHIDPMHVGEAGRFLLIAKKYGEILNREAGNLKTKTLDKLTREYPDHGFVIDRRQADDLFNEVRGPSAEESILAKRLGGMAVRPELSRPTVAFLNSENPRYPHKEKDGHDEPQETAVAPPGELVEASGAVSGTAAEDAASRSEGEVARASAGIAEANSDNGRALVEQERCPPAA